MNPGATRAREHALNRHRAELRAWKRTSVVCLLIGLGMGYYVDCLRWRYDDPPPLQKVEAVTYGFQDKKHEWRSYDTGEPIQVEQWR